MPNLMQILSIFLKLQAVKQSGPGFLAYSVEIGRTYFKLKIGTIETHDSGDP